MSKEKSRAGKPRRKETRGQTGMGEGLCLTRPVLLPVGAASAVLRDGVLQSVEWEGSRKGLEAVLSGKYPGAKEIDPGDCMAGRLLLAYSGGQRVPVESVAAVPVEWDLVRGFRRVVLEELAKVPYGETTTYGELAARAGRGKAARAVGAVMSRNPWPVILPCHRVVGADGKMVGFGKGIDAKRTLLAFEGRNADNATACSRNRQNG